MITKYECSWCHNQGESGYSSPEDCAKHESNCNCNPNNRTCSTCRHLVYDGFDGIQGRWGEDELGCKIFKDATFRKQCSKWKLSNPVNPAKTINPEGVPVLATVPDLAEALHNFVTATETCFEDILKQGHINPINGQAYRSTKATARAILAKAKGE